MIMILLSEPARKTLTGTVTNSGPGWYLVRDSSGRTVRAESSAIWNKGDRVTVIDGVIVGRAGTQKITAVYEV